MTVPDEKAERLAAALRANLARRKAQARARKAEIAPKAGADDTPAPVAGGVIVSKGEPG